MTQIDTNHLFSLIEKHRYALGFEPAHRILGVDLDRLRRPSLFSKSRMDAAKLRVTAGAQRDRSTRVLWAKKYKDVDIIFPIIEATYRRLKEIELESSIPRPIAADSKNGLVITDHVHGNSLFAISFLYCSFGYSHRDLNILDLFRNIGSWLANYNRVATADGSFEFGSFLDRLIGATKNNKTLSPHEIASLVGHLSSCRVGLLDLPDRPMVVPHNDFAMRNVLVDVDGIFNIIDWGTTSSDKFVSPASCWWDLFFMWLNIQSLSRFAPFVSRDRVSRLAEALLDGFFCQGDNDPGLDKHFFKTHVCFVLAVSFLVGMDMNTNMIQHYRENGGKRFVNMVRGALLRGRTDFSMGA